MKEKYMGWYILVNNEPVQEPDLLKACLWIENADNRRILLTLLPNGLEVSTVFLGLDHNFTGKGAPVVFETMIFMNNSGRDLYCDRYCTYKEAITGHAAAIEFANKLNTEPNERTPTI